MTPGHNVPDVEFQWPNKDKKGSKENQNTHDCCRILLFLLRTHKESGWIFVVIYGSSDPQVRKHALAYFFVISLQNAA